jgi:hypothetical protein
MASISPSSAKKLLAVLPNLKKGENLLIHPETIALQAQP